jgi:hypothetical protein
MKNFSKGVATLVALLTVTLQLSSCQSTPQEGQKSAVASTSSDSDQIAHSPGKIDPEKKKTLAIFDDNLRYLYIKADAFKKYKKDHTKKITFRFYFSYPDLMTLHGWFNEKTSEDYGSDDAPPEIQLEVGQLTNINTSSNFYLGNFVLYNEDILKIRNMITNKDNWAVFYPLNPSNFHDQLRYEVFLFEKLPPASIPFNEFKTLGTPTNVITNPSPPKNSNNPTAIGKVQGK